MGIAMTPTTITSTSVNTSMTSTSTATILSMIAASHTSTLTTTTTTTIDATITMITQTIKEATISTDWISQDSVVVGIIFACVFLLFLITSMMTSCYFILKNSTVKKGVPSLMSS